jgi:hypothetical protein
MTGLSFKSAVFSLVIVCFLSGSAVADTFTFTGTATVDRDDMDFFSLDHRSASTQSLQAEASRTRARRGLCVLFPPWIFGPSPQPFWTPAIVAGVLWAALQPPVWSRGY